MPPSEDASPTDLSSTDPSSTDPSSTDPSSTDPSSTDPSSVDASSAASSSSPSAARPLARWSGALVAVALAAVLVLAGCDQSGLQSEAKTAGDAPPTTEPYKAPQAEDGTPRVLMQGFYWDSPADVGSGEWWDFVRQRVPDLAADGFTEIWLPPASKALNDPSMGYDPYDFYDLGEYDQKMGVETWFGSRTELERLIQTAHDNDVEVYADIVANHMSGGDLEYNPNTGDSTYTDFDPKSGEYAFDYNNFHPSTYAESDPGSFAGFPDLAHENPETYNEFEDYQLWLDNTIGFDGWRYDYVKGLPPGVVGDLQGAAGGFGVAEYYDGDVGKIKNWLDGTGNSVSAFDFPLHFALKRLCNATDGSYDLRNLWGSGLLWDRPFQTVTFVSNHDTDKDNPIVTDKMMGYGVMLTHEGLPTVFWKDYYNYGLAKRDKATGIAQLVWVYQTLADGTSSLLHASPDLYVMQRNGDPGLVFVLNDNPDSWKGQTVTTQWAGTTLHAYAWHGGAQPNDEVTDGNGTVKLWAPPRGYAVYAPSGY